MKKDKEVATIDQTSHLPALSNDQRGFEDEIDQGDLIIPRCKLLQPLSPEIREYSLKAGMMINSLTKEELPKEFVPIFYFKEYMRFNPRDKKADGYLDTHEPGAMIWRTRDSDDPRVKTECNFGPNGEHPMALTCLNFFSLFDGQAMPIIITFTKTGYKSGKNLLSLAKLRGGAMFSRKYKLSVKEENNAKGNYFVLKVDPAGDCGPEMFKAAESYFNQFAMKREVLKTHVEDEA